MTSPPPPTPSPSVRRITREQLIEAVRIQAGLVTALMRPSADGRNSIEIIEQLAADAFDGLADAPMAHGTAPAPSTPPAWAVARKDRVHPNAPCHWWPDLKLEDANEHEIELVRLIAGDPMEVRGMTWQQARENYRACANHIRDCLARYAPNFQGGNCPKCGRGSALCACLDDPASRADGTPRTDAVLKARRENSNYQLSMSQHLLELARALERELAEANETIAGLKGLDIANEGIITQLRTRCEKAEGLLRDVAGVVAAHDIESLQCDGKEEEYCDCLSRIIKKIHSHLNPPTP